MRLGGEAMCARRFGDAEIKQNHGSSNKRHAGDAAMWRCDWAAGGNILARRGSASSMPFKRNSGHQIIKLEIIWPHRRGGINDERLIHRSEARPAASYRIGDINASLW